MDIQQEIINFGAKSLGVLSHVVEQFSDQSVQQANDQITLPMEWMNETTDVLFNQINDDCLLEIFSVKSLTLMDLCSLAETCSTFQRIAERVFPKRLDIRSSCNEKSYVVTTYSSSEETTQQDVERIFKNFGSILSALSVSYLYPIPSNFVCNMITKYCLNSIESLKVNYIEMSKDNLKRLKPVFKQLRRLALERVDIGDDVTVFADLNSLIELNVAELESCNQVILGNVYPKLEDFSYRNYRAPPDFLLTFISRHKSLKNLRLGAVTDDSWHSNILQTISDACKQLQQLKLRLFPLLWGRGLSFYSPHLSAFKHLKNLHLWQVSCKDLKFVSEMMELRELHFYYCVLPTDYDQFDFLNKLTKLRVHHRGGSVDLIDIIRRLVNLEHLILKNSLHPGNCNLDKETFSKIVRIVKGRQNTLTIECKFDFPYNSKNREENQNVKLILVDSLKK